MDIDVRATSDGKKLQARLRFPGGEPGPWSKEVAGGSSMRHLKEVAWRAYERENGPLARLRMDGGG